MGVPFINPILEWDHDNPTNRDEWYAQHLGLRYLDPPYVYNVFKGDNKGFIAAIESAKRNPIERYILPRMKLTEVERRLRELVENDWQTEAERIMEIRRKEDKPVSCNKFNLMHTSGRWTLTLSG